MSILYPVGMDSGNGDDPSIRRKHKWTAWKQYKQECLQQRFDEGIDVNGSVIAGAVSMHTMLLRSRKIYDLLWRTVGHRWYGAFTTGVHTNLKIIAFLVLIVYAYTKMKLIRPNWRLHLFHAIDSVLFLLLLAMKNTYHRATQERSCNSDSDSTGNAFQSSRIASYRSDTRNLISLLLFMLLNRISGGTTQRTLEEDFFFSSSGNLLLAYFLM